MCIFVFVFFFFLSSFSFSLPMHPNMAWVCCWLSSLPRECSSSSQNVVEEEPVGMLPQKSYLFCVYIYIFFIEYRALICKILGYRAVVEFVWKLRVFLVEILRRELFSMFMRKVILKAVRSTSIQLQKIYQVYFRLPFEYLKFSWRESDEVIIRTRYNQAKE